MSGLDAALADVNTALAPPQSAPPAAAAPVSTPGATATLPDVNVTAPAPSGVDAALADISKSPEQLHAKLGPPPAHAGGIARNVGAGANETLAGIVGMPVDAASWLINKVTSPFTGTAENEFGAPTKLQAPPDIKQPPAPQPLIQNPVGGSESIEKGLGYIGANPENVGVNDMADRYARAAGAAAAGMAIPGAGMEAMAPRTAGMLRTGLNTAGNAAIGATSGVTGQGAADLLPPDSPWRPLASMAGQFMGGGLVAGGAGLGREALNFGVDQGRDVLAPMTQAGREGIVGNQLREATSDLPATLTALDQPQELVPGSEPTTFQQTGDQGLGQLERSQRTQFPAPFIERAGEQNAARVGALGELAPANAQPGAVRDLLQQRLDQIDADGNAMVQQAQNVATVHLDANGQPVPAQELGGAMRDQLEAAKTQTKKAEGALWKAIDPDGNLTINGTPITQAANQIRAEMPQTAAPMAGEEANIFNATRLLGAQSPFSDVTALRGRLLDAIRTEAATNGQSQAWRRMQLLRGSIDDTMSALTAHAADTDPGLLDRMSAQVGKSNAGQQASAVGAGSQGGRYGNGVPPAVPSVAPQGNTGAPGTGGYPQPGLGDAAGREGLPEEAARPQDIVQFLQDRGGIKDEGGELRSMDANLVSRGYFGRLANSNGMPLDHAREIAAEAGYLHPDADINDLLNSINETYHGNPTFSDRDASQVADWKLWDNARRQGAFEPQEAPPFAPGVPHTPPGPWDQATDLPPFPGPEAPTWDAAAQARYRAAANATRQRAQTFNNPQVGPALQERGGMYRVPESSLPGRFLASPEAAQRFMAAGGDPATLKTALVSEVRQTATNADGTLNPTKFAGWQMRRQPILSQFPELRAGLQDAATAQQAVDQVSAQTRQASLDFQRGAARHFLNAEPNQAVSAALGGKNPVADMAELSRLTAADPDASAGLRRAVADYISQRFIGNTEVGTSGVAGMKSDAFQTFLKTKGAALDRVFSPDQMSSMHAIADDLARSNRSLVGSKLPAQSNTAQDINAVSRLSVLKGYLGKGMASAVGGLGGYLLAGVHGAIEGAGGVAFAKGALDRLRAAGLEQTNQLMTEALLNPDLAKTLLMKASPGNRPFIAQRLGQQLGALGASAGIQNATQH